LIDLRSDTVTRPTARMRAAMAEAEVGDDVFGEDPTVARLEDQAARIVGKQAGLFVASGTMGNLAALLTHCGRGDEVILGDRSHTLIYEVGGMAALGGIHPRSVPNLPDGGLDPAAVEAAVRPEAIVYPPSRLLCLENTHNGCGGAVLDRARMVEMRAVAERHGLAIHLDGARLFNAAVALDVAAAELAADADSVTFCLSKGLSAPVGSVLCGSTEFVSRARKARKMLGGGMRQAGVLAAAGIVALETMVDRLVEDHSHASVLAHGLAELQGIELDPASVRTNIVLFRLVRPALSPAQLVDRLARRGVALFAAGGDTLRAVTHRHVDVGDVDEVLEAFKAALADA